MGSQGGREREEGISREPHEYIYQLYEVVRKEEEGGGCALERLKAVICLYRISRA